MAAPGSPLDPRAHGSNSIIKQGATLFEGADDVIAALEALGGAPRRPISAGPLFQAATPAPGLACNIAALLSPTPVHINDLARMLEQPAGVVAASLMEFEMEGRAASRPGGFAATAGAAFS